MIRFALRKKFLALGRDGLDVGNVSNCAITVRMDHEGLIPEEVMRSAKEREASRSSVC